jgi:tetratricopeptide (TPR) repeat protein
MTRQGPQIEPLAADRSQTTAEPSEPGGGPSERGRAVRLAVSATFGAAILIAVIVTVMRSPAERARWYLAAAREEHAQGDLQAAIGLLRKAVDTHPGNGELHAQLAQYYFEDEDDEKCLTSLERLVELRPQDARAYLMRGHYLRRMRRYEEAVRDADVLVRLAEQRQLPSLGRGLSLRDALNNAAYFRALAGKELDRALHDADIAVEAIRSAAGTAAGKAAADGHGNALKRPYSFELGCSLAATLDTRGYVHYRLAEIAEGQNDAGAAQQHLKAARADLDEALDLHVGNVREFQKLLLMSEPYNRVLRKTLFDEAVDGLGEMYYHRGLVLGKLGERRRADRDRERARAYGFDVEKGH